VRGSCDSRNAGVTGYCEENKAYGRIVADSGPCPEMLKALNSERILWLTRVCQVA